MEIKISWRRLDNKVIAVAVEGAIKDWAGYIGAVAGKTENEWKEVAERGTKLPQEVAEVLFPEFGSLRWRP